MDMNPFPEPSEDEPIPITAWLTPAQFARLDAAVAWLRATNACTDDNDGVDYIFKAGIALVEIDREMTSTPAAEF